ncbi:MAG: hypothetical protein ABTQ34_09335 [Bdellovibrionales bacterium]
MIDAFRKIFFLHSALGRVRLSSPVSAQQGGSDYKIGRFVLEDRTVISFGEERHRQGDRVVSATYYLFRTGEDANHIGFTLGNVGEDCGRCLEIFSCSSDGHRTHALLEGSDMGMQARDDALRDFLSGLEKVSDARAFDELLSTIKMRIDNETDEHGRGRAIIKPARGGIPPTCG